MITTFEKTKELNTIIVDDEIDACRNLQKILVDYIGAGINILSLAHNTADAERQIMLHKPDVVFLDIEMPHENAFEFLERISPVDFEVIFVTAFDEYAIRAFKLNAIDYILKPISIEEVSNAVSKLRDRIAYKKIIGISGNSQSELNNIAKLNKIRLKDNMGFDIVDFRDILYVEAKGSYSRVCFLKDTGSEKSTITSNSLNEYEELFPPDLFHRIHRSYLVNCTHIKKVLVDDNSFIIMKNKVKLPVSRRRITELMEFFKK
jgi:two-component system LytT family response regulator